MSVGDKHEALMKQDLGVPDGVATLDENGRGAEPPALHAAQHAKGGSDPLTAADLGVVSSEVLDLIGSTVKKVIVNPWQMAHCEMVVEAVDGNSYLVFFNDSGCTYIRYLDGAEQKRYTLATTDYATRRNGYGYYNGNIDTLFDGGTWLVLIHETESMSPATGTFPVTDTWFTLSVFPGGTGSITQIASTAYSAVYHRHYNGVEWSPWQQIATTDYVDALTAADVGSVATGYITTGTDVDNLEDGVYTYNGWADLTISIPKPFSNKFGIWIKKTPYRNTTLTNRADIVVDTQSGRIYTMYGYDGVWDTGAGNKPTGTYTGNGDATSRTIETGGIGNSLMVFSDNGIALISPWGAILAAISDVTATRAAYFVDGQLTLGSDHALINANGITYTYQVL